MLLRKDASRCAVNRREWFEMLYTQGVGGSIPPPPIVEIN